MEEMKYSDEILQRAFQAGRGLTNSERSELREAYLWEQQEDSRSRDKIAKSVKDFRDTTDALNMPRHRLLNKFPHLSECPVCFKMRGYNPANQKEYNHMQSNPDDFCMKPQLHNEANFIMFFGDHRERIDLDEARKQRMA